jgi:hypothetical protein
VQARQSSYKNVYRTNIQWGGGAKEHPGKRRDPRGYSLENNNYQLSTEKWAPNYRSRQELLEMAEHKHQP